MAALLQKDFKIEIDGIEYMTTEDIRVEFPDNKYILFCGEYGRIVSRDTKCLDIGALKASGYEALTSLCKLKFIDSEIKLRTINDRECIEILGINVYDKYKCRFIEGYIQYSRREIVFFQGIDLTAVDRIRYVQSISQKLSAAWNISQELSAAEKSKSCSGDDKATGLEITFPINTNFKVNFFVYASTNEIKILARHNFVINNSKMIIVREPVTSEGIVSNIFDDCRFLTETLIVKEKESIFTRNIDLPKVKNLQLASGSQLRIDLHYYLNIEHITCKIRAKGSWIYFPEFTENGKARFVAQFSQLERLEQEKITLATAIENEKLNLERFVDKSDTIWIYPIPKSFNTQQEKDVFMQKEISRINTRLTAIEAASITKI